MRSIPNNHKAIYREYLSDVNIQKDIFSLALNLERIVELAAHLKQANWRLP